MSYVKFNAGFVHSHIRKVTFYRVSAVKNTEPRAPILLQKLSVPFAFMQQKSTKKFMSRTQNITIIVSITIITSRQGNNQNSVTTAAVFSPFLTVRLPIYLPLAHQAQKQSESTMAADNVCNVSEYEDPFADFENFTNTAPIIAAHNRVPRFGHSNDILDLISGSRNEQKDYLTGVFAFSILVCCIFLAWSFLLCLWKGMGSKRVGFLSGQRQALPPRPGGTTTTTTTTGQQKVLLFHDDDDDNGETTTTAAAAAVAQPSAAAAPTYGHSYDENPILSLPDDVPPSMDPAHGNSSTANTNAAVSPTGDDDNGIYAGTKPSASQVPAITTQTPEQWDVMYQKKLCQQKWMKATVAIACAVVVAMAVLMGVLGVGSLTGSMDDSQTSLYNAQQLIGVGVGYVDDLVTTLTTFQSDLQSLLGDANKLCPTLYPDGICTNISDPSTCNSNGVILNTSAMDQLITWVDSDWAVIGRLDETSDNLLEISNSAADASNKLNKIDWVFWTAVGFDMIVGILALCMLVGLFLPKMLSGIVGCIKHWCLLPFFLICTALAFIFAVAFLITSLMIADT